MPGKKARTVQYTVQYTIHSTTSVVEAPFESAQAPDPILRVSKKNLKNLGSIISCYLLRKSLGIFSLLQSLVISITSEYKQVNPKMSLSNCPLVHML